MDQKYKLSSLENTLKIIEYMAYGCSSREVGITELSESVNLGKSTVHRILNTLLEYDYIVHNESNGKYSLGYKFVNVADAILERLDIITVTRCCIEPMVDRLSKNAVLCSFANQQNVTIESYPCRNRGLVVYNTGNITPAYAASAGKVFLSELSDKRLQEYCDHFQLKPLTPYTVSSVDELKQQLEAGRGQGYFTCEQEVNEGIMSIAAPVYNANGKIEAALSVYGPLSEMKSQKKKIVTDLLITAEKCTELNQQRF